MRKHLAWNIACNEWRLLRRDRSAWIVLCLLGAAIPASVAIGAQFAHRLNRGNQQLSVEAERGLRWLQARTAKMEEQRAEGRSGPISDDEFFWGPRKPPYAAWWRPLHATLPPAPLQAFAIGESDVLPIAFEAHPWRMEARPSAESVENPVRLRNGEFDLANVVLLFYPLLIIAVTFNVLAAERESGILALALAQPVRLWTLLLAKLITRFLLVTGTTVSLTWVAAWLGGVVRQDTAPALLMWTGAVILYGCFWFAAAAVLNLGSRSAAVNGLLLSLLWIWLVLVMPTGVSWIAGTAYPTPSRSSWIAADRIAKQEIYRFPIHHNASAMQQDERLLGELAKNHPELNWKADEELVRRGWSTDLKYRDFDFFRDGRGPRINAAWAEEYDRRLQPLEAEFQRQKARQRYLVQRAGILSPAIALQALLHELAGTSGERYADFLRQRDRYFKSLHEFLWPMVFTDAVFTPEQYDRLPRFSYHEEPWDRVFRRVAAASWPLVVTIVAAIGLVGFVLRVSKDHVALG